MKNVKSKALVKRTFSRTTRGPRKVRYQISNKDETSDDALQLSFWALYGPK